MPLTLRTRSGSVYRGNPPQAAVELLLTATDVGAARVADRATEIAGHDIRQRQVGEGCARELASAIAPGRFPKVYAFAPMWMDLELDVRGAAPLHDLHADGSDGLGRFTLTGSLDALSGDPRLRKQYERLAAPLTAPLRVVTLVRHARLVSRFRRLHPG